MNNKQNHDCNKIEYEYITWLLGTNYIDQYDIENMDLSNNYKWDLYDIITVKFISSISGTISDDFILEPYGAKIKSYYFGDREKYNIENKYIENPEYKSSPYVLVKLSNDKFGYIHTSNFDPIEFNSQDKIKNILLDFLLN